MSMPATPYPSPLCYRLEFDSAGATRRGTVRSVHVNGASISLHSHYRVADERIAHAFGLSLATPLADLVDVALAAYVADRVSPRQHFGDYDPYKMRWRRHFSIRLPIREPERWRERSLSQSLCSVLEYFTDDCWSFDFVQRRANNDQAEVQGYLFPTQPPHPVEVAPFSAGLDSLAGSVHRLAIQPELTLASFAAGTNRQIIGRQNELFRVLSNRFHSHVLPVMVPFGLCKRGHAYDGDEPTQRSRGFVYLALTAVTAVQAGCNTAKVYENGVGAIGLPYNRTQWGVHNTRAAHPLSLISMSKFMMRLLNQSFSFHNPFLFETKGIMCRKLAAEGLGQLAARSVSCDGFPQRVTGALQCGICTSCLLRRQALHAAGLSSVDSQSGYRYDVTDPNLFLEERQLYQLRAMLDQVNRLRICVNSASPWEQLSESFPVLEEIRHGIAAFEGRDVQEIAEALVSLYRTYVQEWDLFPYRLPMHKCTVSSGAFVPMISSPATS